MLEVQSSETVQACSSQQKGEGLPVWVSPAEFLGWFGSRKVLSSEVFECNNFSSTNPTASIEAARRHSSNYLFAVPLTTLPRRDFTCYRTIVAVCYKSQTLKESSWKARKLRCSRLVASPEQEEPKFPRIARSG